MKNGDLSSLKDEISKNVFRIPGIGEKIDREQIEGIIRDKSDRGKTRKKRGLRGSVQRYDRPFDSVAEDDWETNR